MRKIENREEAQERQKASNRAAVSKYQEKFKRVNCRFEPDLYDRIVSTGQSVNSFIIKAVENQLKADGF